MSSRFLGGYGVKTDSYFNVEGFRFHGPDGFEADYSGLTSYFEAVRAAFDDLSIRRGIIVVDGDHVVCQTWIEGRFVRQFTQSPAGSVPPNGKHIIFALMNVFRLDADGKIIEEWVETDNRGLLRQLGASEA